MKLFIVAFFILTLSCTKIQSLKCLVCDSIYQSEDSAYQLKECDEYTKKSLEFEEKLASEDEKLSTEDQLSLKAYYHNMAKLENLLKKKSSSNYNNTNDSSKDFDICISKFGVHGGKRVKMKACGKKKWESCKNDNDKEIFESCSTCETDYCNTLQCYSCGDRFDGDISHITPCKDTIQNFCYGDHIKCFSATGVKNGQKVDYRGCIYKNEIEIATKFFETEALSHYFCEKKLCNEQSSSSTEKADYKCDNGSCKNKNRYKKSAPGFNKKYIQCLVCEGVPAPDGPCKRKYCEEYLTTKSTKLFNCLSASGTINGEQRMYKTCVYEGSNKCEDLKKEGYDSCSTCDDDLCNGITCYKCEIIGELGWYYQILDSCQTLEESKCDEESPSDDAADHCYSANASLHGKNVISKGCINTKGIQDLKKYFDSYGFSYYVCKENLCNKNN